MLAPELTENDFLEIGLEQAKVAGWKRCLRETNIERFRKFYLVTPATCAATWKDLNEAGDICKKDNPAMFLLGVRFLFVYENETNLGNFFGIKARNTVGKYCKIWVEKIRKLLIKKVSAEFCSKNCSLDFCKISAVFYLPNARWDHWRIMIGACILCCLLMEFTFPSKNHGRSQPNGQATSLVGLLV
jgi:hypothetical protein